MKVAIYLRVSTADQTTLNQELELKSYCERNNYEIYKIYKDEGVSGIKTSRPQLDLMLQDMRNKLFGAIIVWSKNNINSKKDGNPIQSLFNFNPVQIQTQSPTQAKNISPTNPPVQVKELQIIEVNEGTGSAVKNDDTVEVNYVGAFIDGKKFDSSYDRNEPFVFKVGANQVISGWERGILGMKIGGVRRMVIPSDLAYGATGNGPIPPNTPLLFEIELISIK